MSMSANTFDSLQLKNVGRSFGGQDALVGLNLTIRQGEFIALLGPSGCGKSTALNCLAGLLPLTHGEILIDDERVDLLPAEKRDFGMVFQNYALFPHLTVEKNIAFGLQMRKVSKPELKRRVAEAIALVKLEQHATKLPGQLSGGQQQRVAIVRAIATNPELLLLDEITSALDPELVTEVLDLVRDLKNDGTTIVMATHEMAFARDVADRVVFLDGGVIAEEGPATDVLVRPREDRTRAFLSRFIGPDSGDPLDG